MFERLKKWLRKDKALAMAKAVESLAEPPKAAVVELAPAPEAPVVIVEPTKEPVLPTETQKLVMKKTRRRRKQRRKKRVKLAKKAKEA